MAVKFTAHTTTKGRVSSGAAAAEPCSLAMGVRTLVMPMTLDSGTGPP
jgi:hypothetical protein